MHIVGIGDVLWWAPQRREMLSSHFFLLPPCGFLLLTGVWKHVLFVYKAWLEIC